MLLLSLQPHARAEFQPENPLSDHFFVFTNKSKNRCKILFYDKGGLCLLCKRLELGAFAIPLSASQEIRNLVSLQIIETLFEHGSNIGLKVLPKSSLGMALAYVNKRRAAVIYSMVGTCELLSNDVYKFFSESMRMISVNRSVDAR